MTFAGRRALEQPEQRAFRSFGQRVALGHEALGAFERGEVRRMLGEEGVLERDPGRVQGRDDRAADLGVLLGWRDEHPEARETAASRSMSRTIASSALRS